MNLQGFELINGFSGSLITGNLFTQAIALLQSAIDDIGKVKKDTGRSLGSVAEQTADVDLLLSQRALYHSVPGHPGPVGLLAAACGTEHLSHGRRSETAGDPDRYPARH